MGGVEDIGRNWTRPRKEDGAGRPAPFLPLLSHVADVEAAA